MNLRGLYFYYKDRFHLGIHEIIANIFMQPFVSQCNWALSLELLSSTIVHLLGVFHRHNPSNLDSSD